MITGTRFIRPADVRDIFPDAPPLLNEYIWASCPLVLGTFDREPVCLLGLCPSPQDPDLGYVWGWNTPSIVRCRISYARWARRLIRDALTLRPTIVGHCTQSKSQWLASLGATFEPYSDNMLAFTIKASP